MITCMRLRYIAYIFQDMGEVECSLYNHGIVENTYYCWIWEDGCGWGVGGGIGKKTQREIREDQTPLDTPACMMMMMMMMMMKPSGKSETKSERIKPRRTRPFALSFYTFSLSPDFYAFSLPLRSRGICKRRPPQCCGFKKIVFSLIFKNGLAMHAKQWCFDF